MNQVGKAWTIRSAWAPRPFVEANKAFFIAVAAGAWRVRILQVAQLGGSWVLVAPNPLFLWAADPVIAADLRGKLPRLGDHDEFDGDLAAWLRAGVADRVEVTRVMGYEADGYVDVSIDEDDDLRLIALLHSAPTLPGLLE